MKVDHVASESTHHVCNMCAENSDSKSFCLNSSHEGRENKIRRSKQTCLKSQGSHGPVLSTRRIRSSVTNGSGKHEALLVQLQENVKGQEEGSDGVTGPNAPARNVLLCPMGLEQEETPSRLTYKMQYLAGSRLRGQHCMTGGDPGPVCSLLGVLDL